MENQQVTIRRLKDTNTHQAQVESLKGRLMRVVLSADSAPENLQPGDLVEIDSAETLYLGEIAERHEAHLAVNLEHAVDRSALALIQEMWGSSGRERAAPRPPGELKLAIVCS